MDYIKLKLKTTKDKAQFISEILTALDAISITFSDTYDDEIFEPPVGETPLWQNTTINALFEPSIDKKHIKKILKEFCNIENLTFEILKDRVWQDECKKDFHIKKFGENIYICPSWEDKNTLPQDAITIDIDPGLAFGTGSHQTTDLCLEYLDKNPPKHLNVIDYGCGSGILAIAAKKLGAEKVTAIDNDNQAVIATKDNAKNNQVKIKTLHTDNENKKDKFDLLIANILAKPLVGLASHFANLVKTDGKIVLSGILDKQLEMILATYNKYFDNLQVKQRDNWLLITGVRK